MKSFSTQALAWFVNHYLVEPVIWVIGAYGIILSIIATSNWGFFTLKQYSLTGLAFIVHPSQIQSLDLWYQAYPYSLLIFGSYLLALYLKFNGIPKIHKLSEYERQQYISKPPDREIIWSPINKGYLAMPLWMLTYALWDFTGIGQNIVHGYSVIWLGIMTLALIYYIPLRKQFEVNVNLYALLIFFGFGVMGLQNIVTFEIPFLQHYPLIAGQPIFTYINAMTNELTWCILCFASISLKKKPYESDYSSLDREVDEMENS